MKATGSMVRRFTFAKDGTIFVKFALLMPVVLAVSLSAIDYAWTLTHKSVLQDAADSAAMAGAKELSLSDSKRENVAAVVEAMVERYLEANRGSLARKNASKPIVQSSVTDDPLQVEVTITQAVKAAVGGAIGLEFPDLVIRSVARVVGQPNICVLALSHWGGTGILLENEAKVTGRNCSVFSNSVDRSSIRGRSSAMLTANFICSAGGYEGAGNFSPEPMVDCPTFEDPLANRQPPIAAACTETDLVLSGGSYELDPGTYCGGITIQSADVRLKPGVYTMQDGPLRVDAGGKLTGQGVGIYLTGDRATLTLLRDTSISLEAPTTGEMAGLLVYEDRAQPVGNPHIIYSNDARVLLGTIYLPRGMLMVDAGNPVADQSAYTAIIADKMRLKGGPHLILNTDYDKTDVPVPKGIRGAGQPVSLVE
ncbi:MAG: pilus assembly protein [Alphaproteobacteria bacterium]|nr:pilus assembly protein [Alphaproteobacteria bacterium]